MSAVVDWFASPFAHDFMLRGVIVASLVGAVSALISCFIVLRGWSLMGDAISHAVLPGVVVAAVAGLPIFLGATVAGLGCALASGFLGSSRRVKPDTAIAIAFSGLFALGLVLLTRANTGQDLMHLLFGNMLGVRWRDVIEIAAISLPTSAIVLGLRRDLVLVAFDPAHARAMGLPVARLELLLLVLLTLAVVAALQAVGIILAVAMLITPGAIGLLLTKRFDAVIATALAVAVGSSVVGAILSFHADTATGPTIVVLQSALFLCAVGMTRFRAFRRSRAVS
jgi:manganese/iron transport system permease protein